MRLLDDSPEGIQARVNEELDRMGLGDLVTAANATGSGGAGVEDDSGAVRVTGLAGKWYGQFAGAVNEGMEERDAQLTLLYVRSPPLSFRFRVMLTTRRMTTSAK